MKAEFYCKKLKKLEEKDLTPTHIITTHHHFDHVEGNLIIKEKYGAEIVGAEADRFRIAGMDIMLKDGDVFKLGDSEAHIISADGHTIGHILWYFAKDKILFTGDVLFNLCIGGLFEGTAEQMWNTLEKIKNLKSEIYFRKVHTLK